MNRSMNQPPEAPAALRVLLIEDDSADAEYLKEILSDQRDQLIGLDWVTDFEEARNLAARKEYDIVILDLFLPGSTGFDTFHQAQAIVPDIPIVVLTGLDDQELALRMVKGGAQDYVVKTALDGLALAKTLRYAVERARLREQLDSSRMSFLNLLSDNSDGILVVDEEQRVVFANPAAEQLFDQPIDGLLGTPFGLPVSSSGPIEVDLVREDHESTVVELRTTRTDWLGEEAFLVILHDVTRKKKAEREREELIAELREALAEVRKLSGLLPICSHCKKIRDDQGYWQAVDKYISSHSGAQVSHSICPECLKELYPDLYSDEE